MYLKEIRAQGFKSFADKTIIELDKNITGVVGPNGSGKSNIVDAVRWVLGEQSVKSLRGTDNMTDVIFSGSKSRNQLNVASVALIFDNTDHYLNLDYNEVELKRTVYRDGTNEYSINGEKCRLKDIAEILMDTGIAKESFNIISQGKIEEILSTKSTDRRIIFEEAAGVLKYKKRKEESLRKLERTHDNMNRLEDIIHELELQVVPLKEQKEKALEYLDVKEELEKIEVALLAVDIKSTNDIYQDKKDKIDKLKQELILLTTSNTGGEAELSSLKLKYDEINEQISKLQRDLVTATSEAEKLNGRKNIILERQKYSVDDSKLHDNLVSVKENVLRKENEIKNVNTIINIRQDELDNLNTTYIEQEHLLDEYRSKRSKLDNTLSATYRKQANLKSQIEDLKEQIENNSVLPVAVKSILNNPKINGIHNVIGNLFDLDSNYNVAITIALGLNSTNVVVENEYVAKECINYLKFNNLGRATFFPLNIIRPKGIDYETLEIVKRMPGYINIASKLLNYDKRYFGIIENQLGNVIVVDNIDNANLISKAINYKYRIVTLDGEMLHVGGSLSGGAKQKVKNSTTMKIELDDYIKEYENIIKEIKSLEDSINNINITISEEENKLYDINKNKLLVVEELNSKKNTYETLHSELENLSSELNSLNNMENNNLDKEEEEVLEEFYKASALKETLSNELSSLISKRSDAKMEIDEKEHSLKMENSEYNIKAKELNAYEVDVSRLDVKIDNMLNILSETYNLTYEKALQDYKLEIDVDVARNKVSILRKKMKEIGMVNLAAIEEYDKVSERYEFLIQQREDLLNAEHTLLEIIKNLDDVMKKDFIETFNIIKAKFSETFRELFNGGYAELKLTDENNLLETGIDIIAQPPGKKLTTISLLSGGEKTFTAISLLFAILKSRTVPFCILDEVEAALDEVNVDSFGNYLKKLAEKTQFIVITHKKKTMEYMNSLYGITMQESGVSKLVSVRLEEIS